MRKCLIPITLVLTLAGAPALAAQSLTLETETGLALANALIYPRETYAGRDADGVPFYVERPFSLEERHLLREHFGIEEPGRLFLSDSTANAYLMYDTERDPGDGSLVHTYRVGAESIRREGESWEELERRIRSMKPAEFPTAVRKADTSLASLDAEARPAFRRMLREARRAGHRVRITESYRTPERQAYLLVRNDGLTFTATSKHSAGRAIDVVVGDGNLKRAWTRARWIAFRRWVERYEGGRFRLIGEPGRSWDWPHVELAAGPPGYGSIETLLAAARAADSGCVHSTNDLARSGAAPFAGPGSDCDEVRGDGPAGWAALSAR
jgi:uncharacterized membrane protein